MPTYKDQLLEGLAAREWEQVEVDAAGLDWWADEYWRIRSTRESYGLELVLTFLVDPGFEEPRKKGQGIWVVAVSADVPRDRLDVMQDVELCMHKGRFDQKLVVFLNQLDEYRERTNDGRTRR